MEIVAIAWARYQRGLHAQPLATKAATAAVIGATADLLAQRLSAPGSSTQLTRALKGAAFGALWTGPALHCWMRFMETKLFHGAPHTLSTVLKKTLVDQLLYGAWFPCV